MMADGANKTMAAPQSAEPASRLSSAGHSGGSPAPKPPPGPQGREKLRMLKVLTRQEGPLEFLDQLGARYGDVALLDVPKRAICAVKGPEALRHVLLANQDNYGKSSQYELLTPVLGNGLVTSQGELWQRQRKLVQPMFAKRHLEPFADHMAAAADAALGAWETGWQDGQRIELSREILHVGLDTVGRALVSHDFSGHSEELGVALANALHQVGAASRSVGVNAIQLLPRMTVKRATRLGNNRRWKSGMASAHVLVDVASEMIDERLRNGHGDRDDLLRLLMEATDEETGQQMSRQQVLDELLTFVAAGHETTAHGLSWMYYLLSQNPQAREQMEAEVDDVLGGRVPLAADVERLPWTKACFEEAMRIFPPVWHVQRVALDDDVICGYAIARGTRVFASIWTTHRDPEIWENPAGFDPRRWLGEAPKQRPRFSYLPFGGGRRICVGQGFAMMNATILAAMIAQRFRFDFVPGSKIVLDPTVTLRPLHGIPVIVRRRPGAATLAA
jgi:cytochrome P450